MTLMRNANNSEAAREGQIETSEQEAIINRGVLYKTTAQAVGHCRLKSALLGLAWGGLFASLGAQEMLDGEKTYSQAGNHVWIVPEGVSEVTVEAIGGGGAGGRSQYCENWSAPERHERNIIKKKYDYGQDTMYTDPIEVHGPARVCNGGYTGNGFWTNPIWSSIQGINWRGSYFHAHHLPPVNGCEEWSDSGSRQFAISVRFPGQGVYGDYGHQNFDIQHLDRYNIYGLNGNRGQETTTTIPATYGDVFEISIGVGGENAAGGDTRVVLKDAAGNRKPIPMQDGSVVEELIALGGARGSDGQNGRSPTQSMVEYTAGHGGRGGQTPNIPGDAGQSGEVRITYKQEDLVAQARKERDAKIEELNKLSDMAQNSLKIQGVVLGRLDDYKQELALGLVHADEIMAACVASACNTEPALADALHDIESMRDSVQYSAEVLSEKVKIFGRMFLGVVQQHPDVIAPLFPNMLTAGDTEPSLVIQTEL